MDNKEKKVTASEVVGELRRTARQYEVFKHAADAAEILANAEKIERQIKLNVMKLKDEHSVLDRECDEMSHKKKHQEAKLKELDEKVAHAQKNHDKLVSEAKYDANLEAGRIVAGAERKLEELKKEVVEVNNLKMGLQEDVAHARQALSEVTNHIEDVKAKAIKAMS